MESLQILALALGAAWASGINLYATAVLLGVLDMVGVVPLPDEMQILSNPLVLAAAATAPDVFPEPLNGPVPAVLTPTEAVSYLRLDEDRDRGDALRSLERLMRRGEIRPARIGARNRIARVELLRFVLQKTATHCARAKETRA